MGKMSDDYGTRMGNALRAVRQMHSDAARLLQDCDTTIGSGRKSIFDMATRDLTWKVDATQWMAEGVYRYYDASDQMPGLVEAVLVAFIDRDKPERPEEPLLIVGRIKYGVDTSLQTAVHPCEEWDLWYAYFDWYGRQESVGRPVMLGPRSQRQIEWVKFFAVPLYSVTGMDVVVRGMETVRQDQTGLG
jgi:hypothetical protein